MTLPKILTLDCETSPNIAHVWSLWDQNVSLAQLQESTSVISWAAKWHGSAKVHFMSDYHDASGTFLPEGSGHQQMVRGIYDFINEADVVIHFNGTTFDMPHLRREFLVAGLSPPKPVQEIDLLKVAKSRFRFTSNKLDYITQYLGLPGKIKHSGHSLWVQCMAGDEKAWKTMRRYNKADVVITEQLYDRLRQWTKAQPHAGLFSGTDDCCARCGSTDLERRGFAYTPLASFQQFRCRECGSWSRSARTSC